jgi:putative pyruvate formate lyase activating enzyme
MPNHIENSKKVLKWIKENMPEDIYVSVMNQYFPTYKAKEIKDINRKLTTREIKKIEEYIYSLNLKNGYIQDIEENEQQYVPNWKDVTLL